MKYLKFVAFVFPLILTACGEPTQISQTEIDGIVTIYTGKIITMDKAHPHASAVAVHNGKIVGLGSFKKLAKNFTNAQIDTQFANKIIMPGFIDPHIHMALAAIQYALPIAPPWQIATRNGIVEGYADRKSFLAALRKIEAQHAGNAPLIIYGYHNLVHGNLTRQDLDAITSSRPLFIWHYSSHDYYLNSAALKFANITPSMHKDYEGIAIDANGNLTGRVFEDALPYLLTTLAPLLLTPDILARGGDNFSALLNTGGVTSVADLAYGIFGLEIENANIKNNWKSPEHAGYRLFLVPEHRAFMARFGKTRIDVIKNMVSGAQAAPAPVLPQVKFFTDAAFYSQTMRLNPPGYLSGQSKGKLGLWVMPPSQIATIMQPYWEAGFDIHVHSNGDAAQDATLDALNILRESNSENKFVFEHAGLFSPKQIIRAGTLGASISAASHYVFYMGELYQSPLGKRRGKWISPLNSLSAQNIPVTLHSDAPLAPPLPLRAASVHATRITREGTNLHPHETLTPYDALEAITLDAAYVLGLENQIGSISLDKYADFTILETNPLDIDASKWSDIAVWGVVLNGTARKNIANK